MSDKKTKASCRRPHRPRNPSSVTRFIVVALSVYLLLCAETQGQHHWPRFRGPGGAGVAEDDPRLPEVWDAKKNVKWGTDIRGWGWSSPVVWGDRVFLAGGYSDKGEEPPESGYTEEDRPE
jgi:hypothetical protein